MIRWVLSSAAEAGSGGRSDGFNTLDFTALAMTLTRHVMLTLRMIIMAPQSTHFRGGCFILLRRLLQLEKTLCLGRLSLTAGHLYVHSGAVDSGSGKMNTKEKGKGKGVEGIPVSQLPHELPTPLLDLQELKELQQEHLDIDALGMFRRAVTTQKTTDNDPASVFHVLTDITNMCTYLMEALAKDVHENIPESMHHLLTYSSAQRILYPQVSLTTDGETPNVVEENATSLPPGLPTTRATHWQKTKAALMFIAHKPHQPDTEANHEPPVKKPVVVTAKMALSRKEPSSSFVFLKKTFGDIHKQV